MLYLSLPIDSVGHCVRYANRKVFSYPHFPYMDRMQGHTRENTYQRKPVYSHILPSLTYFTDYPRKLHIIEQDIILKINNCKEVFS